jgi:hypothetical protein
MVIAKGFAKGISGDKYDEKNSCLCSIPCNYSYGGASGGRTNALA